MIGYLHSAVPTKELPMEYAYEDEDIGLYGILIDTVFIKIHKIMKEDNLGGKRPPKDNSMNWFRIILELPATGI